MIEISSSSRMIMIAVFAVYTLAVLIWAIKGNNMKSAKGGEDYVEKFSTGGRDSNVFVVAMMVCAGIAGAGVFLGVPGFIYTFGSMWLVCCFWSMSCTLTTLGIVGKKTGIVARRCNAQTFVELMYHRFAKNKVFGVLASLVMLIFLGGFAVSTMVGGGRIFQVLTGLPFWVGLAIFAALVVIAALTGGVKGVGTSIMIQGIVMTVCVVILFCMGIGSAGPLGDTIRNLTVTYPEWWEPGPTAVKTCITYALLWGFASFTLPHVSIGTLTYKDTNTMHQAMKVGIVVYTIWLIGLNLLAFPIKSLFTDLASADLGIPTLAVTVLPAWIAGLVLAGVCAAVQSSIGGMIMSLSTCVIRDLIQNILCPNLKGSSMKKVTTISTLAVAAVVFAFSVNPPALLAQLITYSTGALMAGFLGVMLLGYYWPRANEYGAIACIIVGIGSYLLMANGIGTALTFGLNASIMASVYGLVAMAIVSLVTPKTPYGIIKVWFSDDYPEEAPASAAK